jgi:hypothetical protein
VTLRVLGTPDLRGADGQRSTSVLAQPKRLCLLTYLALAPSPVSRASIVAVFWPESDEARARNALSQALFHLRRALGDTVVEASEGDRLWASPERIWCDARDLLRSDAPELSALEVCDRELLEGWNAEDSLPLQEWLDLQRAKLKERAARLTAAPAKPIVSAAVPPNVPPGIRREAHSARRRILGVVARGFVPTRASSHASTMGVAALLVAIGLVGVLGAVVVGVAFAASRFGASADLDLVVLLPRVVTAPGAPPLSPETVLEEVIAHLPSQSSLRIIPTPSASSVPDLRRQLAALGVAVDEGPDLILEVSLRVTIDEVRGVALLHRAPTMDVTGREGFGLEHVGADQVLVDLPLSIAGRVTAMVAGALEGSAKGR